MPMTGPMTLGPSVLDPQHLVATFGVIGILAVVFAESGLLIGFFLPGDSLLFTTGLLVAQHTYLNLPLWLVCLLISVAAVAGDQCGYLIGRRAGPALFKRPDARFFRQAYLRRAQDFFAEHGSRSVVLARFVPIVRTFTPVVAGAAGMPYRVFTLYNIIGGVGWGVGVTVLGYFLGQISFVRSNIELILVAIVAISFIPVAIALVNGRRQRQRDAAAQSDARG